MSTIATIWVKLGLNSDGYNTGLDNAVSKADKSSKSISQSMKDVGGSMMAVGGIMTAGLTVPIVAAGVVMAKSAADLGESVNAVEDIFMDASDSVLAFSDTAAEAVGLSKKDFNSLGIVTGSLLQNMGFDMQDAADETISLTERAADMSAVFGTEVSQALEAIQSGLKGEFNPLEQFGVRMNAAMITARALEMGLGDLEGNVDDNAKAQAALSLLYEQTEKSMGTFQAEAEGLPGALKIATAEFANLKDELGKELIPMGIKLIKFVRDIIEKFQQLSPTVKKGILIFAGIVAAIGPLVTIIGAVISAVGAVGGVISGIFAAISAAVLSAGGVFAAVGAAISSVMSAVFSPIVLIIVAIIAAVALFAAAWKNDWGGIRTAIIDVWENTIKPIVDKLIVWFKENIPKAIEYLSDIWENTLLPAIKNVFNWIVENLIPIFVDVVEWLETNIPAAIETVSGFWTDTLWPAMTDVYDWIVANLVPIFVDIWNWLEKKVPEAITTVSQYWTETLIPAMTNAYNYIVDDLIPAIQDTAIALKEDTVAALETTATKWDEYKGKMLEVSNWMTENISPVSKSLNKLLGTVLSLTLRSLAGIWEKVLWPAMKKVGNYILDHLNIAFAQLFVLLLPLRLILWVVKAAVSGLWKAMKNLGGYVKDKLITALGDLPGILDSINTKIENLTTKLQNITLPDWMTPGSPTPWEIGLLGINNALQKVSSQGLPELAANMDISGMTTMPSMDQMIPAGGGITSDDLRGMKSDPIDYKKMARAIRDVMLRERQ